MKSPEKVAKAAKAEKARKPKKPPRHRSNGRGTLRIDMIVPEVGRIAKASGLSDPVAYRRVLDLLGALRGAGRLDILRAVRNGAITPLQLHDVAQRLGNERAFLNITVANFFRLEDALTWWPGYLDKEGRGTARHRRNQINGVRRVMAMAAPANRARLLLTDLPELATQYREQCLAKKAKAEWAHTRTYLRMFVRDRAGVRSPILSALDELGPLTCLAHTVNRRPQELPGLIAFLDTVDPRVAGTLLTMALTGMGPEEFFENGCDVWEEKDCRYLFIRGRKREGRARAVPFVGEPFGLVWGRSTFLRHFDKAIQRLPEPQRFRPYDMRRTFAVALKRSGVDARRHAQYMGHGPRTVTQLYQDERGVVLSPENLRDLKADGELLRSHFADILTWAAGRTLHRRALGTP